MEDPKFVVGVSFKNAEMLQMVLRQHTIEKAFDVHFTKNDKKRITVQCADKECKWRLHVSNERHGETLVIKTMNERQVCRNVNQSGSHIATIRWMREM